MSTAKQEVMRLLESLPDDASFADIHAHIDAARDRFDRRLSNDGITRFHGHPSEFDGKVGIPGALQIAQWEGLGLTWSCDPAEEALTLYLERGDSTSDPALRIPLSAEEIEILRNQEDDEDEDEDDDGWGFYQLKIEPNDDRAAVNVSVTTAKKGPVSFLWILDRQRRAAVTRAINRFAAPPLLTD